MQVFNDRTAQADIDAVHSMGIFDNISITPQYAEGSTADHPKVHTFTKAQVLTAP